MIQVDAKQFSTGAEMIAAAKVARERVMNPAKRVVDTEYSRARKSGPVEFCSIIIDNEDEHQRVKGGYSRAFYRRQKDERKRKENAEKKAHSLAEMKRKREEMLAEARLILENREKQAEIIGKYRTITVRSFDDDLPNLAVDYVKRRALEFGVPYGQIIGPTRLKHVSEARQLITSEVYLKYPHLSLLKIGHVMNRDHTSILWSLRRQGVRP